MSLSSLPPGPPLPLDTVPMDVPPPEENPKRDLVLALVGHNENEALHRASVGIGWYLEIVCARRQKIIDLRRPGAVRELLTALKEEPVDFVYGLAGTGAQLALDSGVNLWTAARVPFVALWHDHPCYNYRQHIVDSPFVLHCYHLRDHLEARQRFLPASSSRAVLLPPPFEPDWNAQPRPMMNREPRILFAKTALQPEAWAQDWQRHPEPLRRALRAIADQAERNRNLDLAAATFDQFETQGLDSGNLGLFMSAAQEVDVYIRSWRSDRLARALLPYPADIVGRGWDYLKDMPRRAEILPPFPAIDYWDKVCAHRVVANSSPLWRDAIHERAWSGIISGAVTLTDRTDKSDAFLGGLPNYMGFDWQDDLDAAVMAALDLARRDDADYAVTTNKALMERKTSTARAHSLHLVAEVQKLRHQCA